MTNTQRSSQEVLKFRGQDYLKVNVTHNEPTEVKRGRGNRDESLGPKMNETETQK